MQVENWLRRPWAHVLLIVALCALPLWQGFTGKALGPWDDINPMMYPDIQTKSNGAWDVLQADGCLQFYVWRKLVLDAWGKGQVPLWNAYELAGTPLLANSQSEALYPPNIVLGVAHVPVQWAVLLLAWLHLAVAGLGIFALVRQLGGSKTGAMLAVISLCLSPFMLGWTALASVPATCAWLAVYWACRVALLRQFSLLRMVQASGALAMMLLAGHLQFAAYGLLFGEMLAFGLWVAGSKRDAKPLLAGFASVLLGVMLASPQVLPAYLFSKESHRQNVASADGYKAYVASAMQPMEYGVMLFPTAAGNPREPLQVAKGKTTQGYIPSLVKPGGNFAESAFFIGPLTIALLALVNWKEKKNWVLAAIALLGTGLVLGTPLNALLYFGVPGWSASGSPARVMIVPILCLLALAGANFKVVTAKELKPSWIALAVAGLVGLVLCAKPLGLAPELSGVATLSFLSAAPYLLVGLVGCALALKAMEQGSKLPKFLLAAAPLALSLHYVFNLVPFGEPPSIKPTDSLARIAIMPGKWSMLNRPNAYFPPNLAALMGIHELGGYDSLVSKDTVAMLKAVDSEDPAPPENGNMMFVKPSANQEVLKELGISQVWGNKLLAIGGNRTSINNRPVPIAEEDFNSIKLEKVVGPGQLKICDRALKGFAAFIDHKPAELKPTETFKMNAVDVPDGTHTVEFRYTPPGYITGLVASAISAAILLVLGILGRNKPISELQ